MTGEMGRGWSRVCPPTQTVPPGNSITHYQTLCFGRENWIHSQQTSSKGHYKENVYNPFRGTLYKKTLPEASIIKVPTVRVRKLLTELL